MDKARFRRLCGGIERLSASQLRELRARLRGLDARIEVRTRINAQRERLTQGLYCGARTLQRLGGDPHRAAATALQGRPAHLLLGDRHGVGARAPARAVQQVLQDMLGRAPSSLSEAWPRGSG